ncbi:MAG TPA: DMT family transporter, partial [Actinomycetota bacterium]|nr:DMT family transporter [Actinomycetota bacterium]
PDTLLNPRFAAWVLFLGVLCTVAPFLMFVWGLERVDASRAGIVSTLEPLAAAGLAFVWLGQRLSVAQTLGGAMVVAGIAIVLTDASDAPPARVETS